MRGIYAPRFVYLPLWAEPHTRFGFQPHLRDYAQWEVDGVPCNRYQVVHEGPISLTLVLERQTFGVRQPVYFEVLRCEVYD